MGVFQFLGYNMQKLQLKMKFSHGREQLRKGIDNQFFRK